MMIFKTGIQEEKELVDVWEKSVRATHHFLKEQDIIEIKKVLPSYFEAVEMYCTKNETGKITGFIGIADKKIEMLFIDPEYFGHSLGKNLINYVLKNIEEVDVNEQNKNAYEFYLHMGFEVVSRDEFDSMGNPFPILHMRLKKS